jgi:hypothetical protein
MRMPVIETEQAAVPGGDKRALMGKWQTLGGGVKLEDWHGMEWRTEGGGRQT